MDLPEMASVYDTHTHFPGYNSIYALTLQKWHTWVIDTLYDGQLWVTGISTQFPYPSLQSVWSNAVCSDSQKYGNLDINVGFSFWIKRILRLALTSMNYWYLTSSQLITGGSSSDNRLNSKAISARDVCVL